VTETLDLEQVIADARSEARVLDATGNSGQADYIDQLLDKVQAAAEEWLTWLSEGDASIRCGFSEAWLRARFEAWRREGHARLVGRVRQYRACVIPRRANTVTAAARGREAAREARGERKVG
jgi:hypothetical protein